MSEYRKECFKCLSNKNCTGDYKGIYCMINRGYNFDNIDYGKEEDRTTNARYIDTLVLNDMLIQEKRKYERIKKHQYKDCGISEAKQKGRIEMIEELLK